MSFREPSTDFDYDSIDGSDEPEHAGRDALEVTLALDTWIRSRSRTLKAAMVRREILTYVMTKHASQRQICRRLRIGRSRFYEILRETRMSLRMAAKPD